MRRILLIAALAAMLLQGCRAARVRTAANAPAPAPDTVFSITLIGDDCKFADHVDYGIYVPGGNRTIRGVMVFQHGCSQEEFGISRHCDVQYQALARKWDLAIVEPTIFGLCDIWAFPENGSYKSLLLALSKAGARTGHPELATAPFLLWGHSGGGLWTLAMLNQHPERIIAAVCYSAAWDPDWDYPEVAYDVPVIFRHAGPGEGADNIPATARHGFAKMRAHDAPASIAYTRGQTHNHSYIRSMTVPFWEAALAQRLAGDGSLQKLDLAKTWLGDTTTFEIFPEAGFTGSKSALCRLPDKASAEVWSEYASTGKYIDKTAPAAPYGLEIVMDGDAAVLKWRAEADIESGIGYFNIYRDGEQIGRVPSEGTFQWYDVNGDQARPVTPPAMELRLTDPIPGTYAVEMFNRDGLASEKATLIRK